MFGDEKNVDWHFEHISLSVEKVEYDKFNLVHEFSYCSQIYFIFCENVTIRETFNRNIVIVLDIILRCYN